MNLVLFIVLFVSSSTILEANDCKSVLSWLQCVQGGCSFFVRLTVAPICDDHQKGMTDVAYVVSSPRRWRFLQMVKGRTSQRPQLQQAIQSRNNDDSMVHPCSPEVKPFSEKESGSSVTTSLVVCK
jgi:hypothetical protein